MFVISNHVVTGVSHQAAEKSRQTRQMRGFVRGENLLHHFKRIVGLPVFDFTIADDFNLASSSFEDQRRIAGEKRVSCDFFSANNAFEQKRIIALAGNSRIGADGREVVRKYLTENRNDVRR